MKLVKDVMTVNPVTISPFSSARDALKLMKKEQVKSLVVDKKDKHDAYGIITYTTILKAIVAEEGDIDLLNVYDLYQKPALSISQELDIKNVAKLMVNQGYKRLLVTVNNSLIGIISMSNVIEGVMESLEEDE